MATYVYDESNEQEKKPEEEEEEKGADAEVDVIKDSLKHHLNGLV